MSQDNPTGLAANGPFPAQKYALAASHPTTCLPRKMQKGTRHFLPFYGFKLPAAFAQIPTCAPRLSGGARTVT